jgi:hypothetical protein
MAGPFFHLESNSNLHGAKTSLTLAPKRRWWLLVASSLASECGGPLPLEWCPSPTPFPQASSWGYSEGLIGPSRVFFTFELSFEHKVIPAFIPGGWVFVVSSSLVPVFV